MSALLPQLDVAPATVESIMTRQIFKSGGQRERDCAWLVFQGMGNEEIGVELGMATRTVKAHLNRIYLRLGIGQTTDRSRLSRVRLTNLLLDLLPPDPGVALSQRFTEVEVRTIELIAAGLRNRDIAGQMNTTEHVIKNYVRAIFDQAGVDSRTQLVVWWRCHRGTGRGRTRTPSIRTAPVPTAKSAGVCKQRGVI